MSNTSLIIDRIEEDYAVIEVENHTINIPLSVLPDDISEGGTLLITYQAPDPTALDEAKSRLERLKQRDSGSQSIDL